MTGYTMTSGSEKSLQMRIDGAGPGMPREVTLDFIDELVYVSPCPQSGHEGVRRE